MLSAIRQIEEYIAGQGHDSFLQDKKTIDAVVRNLEVLGEASRQLPEEFVTQHPLRTLAIDGRAPQSNSSRLFRSRLGNCLADRLAGPSVAENPT